MKAERYTHGHHESVLRSHKWRTADNSAAYLLPHLVPGQSLLDVGCGPGTITADLARLVAPGVVTALDKAAEVLATARQTVADAGAANVVVGEGDVYRLAFPDATFDVVHAHQVLQHLARPVAALAEMRRVCRPGGLVAARDSDYRAFAWYPANAGLDRWLQLYLAIAGANGAEPAAGRRLLAWAHQAGFSAVQPSASTWCYATAEDRHWWAGLWADRVVASAFAAQAVEGDRASTDDLVSIAASWRAWAEEPDGWFVVVHGEVLCRP